MAFNVMKIKCNELLVRGKPFCLSASWRSNVWLIELGLEIGFGSMKTKFKIVKT